MSKKLIILITLIILVYGCGLGNFVLPEIEAEPELPAGIYFFYSQECNICMVQLQKIEKLAESTSNYSLSKYEISENRDNLELMFFLLDEFGKDNLDFSIPIVFIGDQVLTGEQEIENRLKLLLDRPFSSSGDKIAAAIAQYRGGSGEGITGSSRLTALPAVVVAAVIDSINPCAIAIILFLISSLFLSASKKKVLIYGSIYIGTIFIIYLGIGLGFIYFLDSINISPLFFAAVGILLILAGLFSVKDYFWYGRGPSLGIPGFLKKYIQGNIEKATVISVIIVGILISIFESTCSGAVYIGILSLISSQGLNLRLMGLLLLYNFIFILPLLIIMIAFYFGLPVKKINRWLIQKRRKVYRLIAGVVLISLGIYLIIYFLV